MPPRAPKPSLAGLASSILLSLSPSHAPTIASRLTSLPPPLLPQFLRGLFTRLYLLSLSSPTSISSTLTLLHAISSETPQPLSDGKTLKSHFVDFLHGETLSFWQAVVTPDPARESQLPTSFYATSLATGALVGGLFAATPAPNDGAEELEHLWTALVEPILVRSLFGDEQAGSTSAGCVTLLPALLKCAAASIRDFLLLRRKGRGKGYRWYDDGCTQPEQEWGWDDILSQLKAGFNSSYKHHEYPAQARRYWQRTVDYLSNTATDDVQDKAPEEAILAFADEEEEVKATELQVKQTTEMRQTLEDLVEKIASLQRDVERGFKIANGANKEEQFLAWKDFDPARLQEAEELVERARDAIWPGEARDGGDGVAKQLSAV